MDKFNATIFLVLHEFSFLYLTGIYFCKYFQTWFFRRDFFTNHSSNLVMRKYKSYSLFRM